MNAEKSLQGIIRKMEQLISCSCWEREIVWM